MYLKHRNVIAWSLLLIAAVCWIFGYAICNSQYGFDIISSVGRIETTDSTTSKADTTLIEDASTVYSETTTVYSGNEASSSDSNKNFIPEHIARRVFGITLCVVAMVLTAVSVFLLWQTIPVVGPDGVCLIVGTIGILYYTIRKRQGIYWIPTERVQTVLTAIFICFAFLFSVREIIGWLRARLSLSWCAVHRISRRCTKPRISLLLFVGVITAAIMGIAYFYIDYMKTGVFNIISFISLIALTVLGLLCLCKYGADLDHFKVQLNNYRNGFPIEVGKGAFAETEKQLLEVQAQHEEAVRAAVTGERFKVELISNVSHDLRTPLTAILGYGELLQKEDLSPRAKEQLQRLNTKASYMNELVESLFELTKVSSGVVPCKQEKIDLVRLLEQTVGLFDDQLTDADLIVRRNYASDTISIITDGSRMYQVFANLLGNAIKYALSGTRIYLEVKETEEYFVIRMLNTSSYEMDFREDEIMQRFARGDRSRSTKGSGLGLAIAQTYTESVGGRFYVSVDGDQFSATVELPKTERNL